MQTGKVNRIVFLLLLFPLPLFAKGGNFQIPCQTEMRAVQAHILKAQWPEAKNQLLELLKTCSDAKAIERASALAANFPDNLLLSQDQAVLSLFENIEVGLQFDGRKTKAETHWYFKVANPKTKFQIHTLALTFARSPQPLLDTDSSEKHCLQTAAASTWTCLSQKDTSGLPPPPGLYKLEVNSSLGRFSYFLILSESRFLFSAVNFDSSGTTHYTQKIPYTVTMNGTQEQIAASEFQFGLFRQGATEPLKQWAAPAAQFKNKNYLEVPTPGNYRLQLTAHQNTTSGPVHFALESIVVRPLRVIF